MKRILFGVLFSLFLMFHAVPAHANLVSGQVATGSISAGGTSDQYFTGTAGQGAMFSISASYHAYIKIYWPSGTLWDYGIDRYNALTSPLPDTGTYHMSYRDITALIADPTVSTLSQAGKASRTARSRAGWPRTPTCPQTGW